jgi:DMSO reductase anchor subunit
MPKKLQKQSIYAEYDQDGDGIITDDELGSIKKIKQTEDASRKNLAQLRMARFSLIAMGVFTLAMFFIPIDRVNALADISNLFYITGGGIVATYMGTTAWTQRSTNGK